MGIGGPADFITVADPGASHTSLSGINNGGQIVGFSSMTGAFVFNGGVFTPYQVPSASSTILSGINDTGKIVGSY